LGLIYIAHFAFYSLSWQNYNRNLTIIAFNFININML